MLTETAIVEHILDTQAEFLDTVNERNTALLAGRRPLMLAPRGCYPIGTEFMMALPEGSRRVRVLQWWSEKDGLHAAVCWVADGISNSLLPTGYLRVAIAAPGDSLLATD
jgi:hypothetical protein